MVAVVGKGAVGLQHVPQDFVPPLQSPFRIYIGVIVGGAVGDRAEVNALRKGQLIHILVKISFCRPSNSVNPIGVADIIHVEFHNLLFGVFF